MAGSSTISQGKKRGNYNCGRCGLPKKGHICHLSPTEVSLSPSSLLPDPIRPSVSRPCRVLSFDDIVSEEKMEDPQVAMDCDAGSPFPPVLLAEILRRLPPASLMSVAAVCKGWRDCVRRLWRAAAELRFRIPSKAPLGFVGSVLQKCGDLVRLTLKIESGVDATTLACIAFSCPNLESLDIRTSDTAINRITGDELSRFVSEKRNLSNLKIEGCVNLGFINLCSSSLSTLWLSGLHSISRSAFNCPNLKELSLDFSGQENDTTDLTTMVESFGRSCPRLKNIHIASSKLSHSVVLALTGSNLRSLRILSLVLGSEITDASVAAITSNYSNLESLDLSGSSITDNGIGIICNIVAQTLTRLLLALCPNITSSGIQFATAQLPYLQLIDCGMTLCEPNSQDVPVGSNPCFESSILAQKKELVDSHQAYNKLIIKHGRLKKLSLWGCSGLHALNLNCPELDDLNLRSCVNLHPDGLTLQCPNLKDVHVSGCQSLLIESIQAQVSNHFAPNEEGYSYKRMADGSKRVKVPCFLTQQSPEEKRIKRPKCIVHVEC